MIVSSRRGNTAFQQALLAISCFAERTPALHCPATGKLVHGGGCQHSTRDDWAADPGWANVPTVTFAFISTVGTLSYISKEMSDRLSSARRQLYPSMKGVGDFDFICAYAPYLGRAPLVLHTNSRWFAGDYFEVSVFIGLDLAAAA